MAVTPEELGFIPIGECDLRRPVLRDAVLQEEFDRTGHVTVPLLGPDEVATLYDGYVRATEREEGLNPEGAYNDVYAEFSVIHSRPAFREEAFDLITSVLTPAVNRLLVDYRPLVANFVNKPPGTGVVPAHQNWSVVDESHFQSVSVWVALVDCVVENGTMLMYDGSHRWLRGRRGMWTYQAFHQIEEPLVDGYLTPVFAKAGEAVILDDALVHYSPPNATDERRLAIQFVMVPQEADAVFHQQVGEHDGMMDVDVWKVQERFFFDFWHGDGDARYGEVIERIQVPLPHVTERALWELTPEDERPAEPPADPEGDATADDAEARPATTDTENASAASGKGSTGEAPSPSAERVPVPDDTAASGATPARQRWSFLRRRR